MRLTKRLQEGGVFSLIAPSIRVDQNPKGHSGKTLTKAKQNPAYALFPNGNKMVGFATLEAAPERVGIQAVLQRAITADRDREFLRDKGWL
jgi:hypothetical protein